MMCEWCGYAHAQTALCTKRPTCGRRGFLAMFGAGVIGLAVERLNLVTAGNEQDYYSLLHECSITLEQWINEKWKVVGETNPALFGEGYSAHMTEPQGLIAVSGGCSFTLNNEASA